MLLASFLFYNNNKKKCNSKTMLLLPPPPIPYSTSEWPGRNQQNSFYNTKKILFLVWEGWGRFQLTSDQKVFVEMLEKATPGPHWWVNLSCSIQLKLSKWYPMVMSTSQTLRETTVLLRRSKSNRSCWLSVCGSSPNPKTSQRASAMLLSAFIMAQVASSSHIRQDRVLPS